MNIGQSLWWNSKWRTLIRMSALCLMVTHTLSGTANAQTALQGLEKKVRKIAREVNKIKFKQQNAGPVGPQGPQGVQGPQGLAGTQGPMGRRGDTGVAGRDGQQGAQGDRGVAGAAGPQGPQGETGPQGPRGLEGAAGPGVGATGRCPWQQPDACGESGLPNDPGLTEVVINPSDSLTGGDGRQATQTVRARFCALGAMITSGQGNGCGCSINSNDASLDPKTGFRDYTTIAFKWEHDCGVRCQLFCMW